MLQAKIDRRPKISCVTKISSVAKNYHFEISGPRGLNQHAS